MTAVKRRLPLSLALAILCLSGVAFSVGTSALVAPSDSQAFCSGNQCLPAAGYSLDTTFDCGVIVGALTDCYANGTLSSGNAVRHHFGWGSAAYNGAGSTSVRLCGGDANLCYFGGAGTNLIRSCYYDSCVSQGERNIWLYVGNSGSAGHTIFGHGMA